MAKVAGSGTAADEPDTPTLSRYSVEPGATKPRHRTTKQTQHRRDYLASIAA